MSAAVARAPLAPRWHTAVLVGLYLAVAALGTLLQARGAAVGPAPGAHGRVASAYAPLLLVQWGTAFYVCRVGRPASALRALLGAPWRSARGVALDLALAALAWGLIRGVEALAAVETAPSVTALLPQGPAELAAWVVVAVSVGVCEELVFRAYLLTQLEAFTASAPAAVVLQALLFGLAHAEQGPGAAARVALYGLGLGALARWRGGLRAGIVAHVATDLASGLLAR